MRRLSLILLLNLGAFPSQATVRDLYTQKACLTADERAEPLANNPFFATKEWQSDLNQPQLKALFSPSVVDKELRDSNISRSTVSSSHIANIIADGLRSIDKKVETLIREKKYDPIRQGVNYTGAELQKKYEEREKMLALHVNPVLAQLFSAYIDALIHKRDLSARVDQTDAYIRFMEKSMDQQKALRKLIKKNLPTLESKIGEIQETDSNDLPLSYREGYVVKIRFKKRGEKYSVSVYPTLLLNALIGQDDDFITALERWTDYTKAQWEFAQALIESKGAGYYLRYAWNATLNVTGSAPYSSAELLELGPYFKVAFDRAQSDLEHARWVQAQIAKLSQQEIYSLLDLFRALRFGDNVVCQNEVTVLNEKMAQLLGTFKGGRVSSAHPKFTKDEKTKIDSLAKDIAFYQDMYKVYSTAAAVLDVQRRRK